MHLIIFNSYFESTGLKEVAIFQYVLVKRFIKTSQSLLIEDNINYALGMPPIVKYMLKTK